MRRKLFLLLAGVLVALWSQTGLAWCKITRDSTSYGRVFNTNVVLNQTTAGNMILDYKAGSEVNVQCDKEGGWFELRVTAPINGSGLITIGNDRFIGVSITSNLLNANASGYSQTLLTDGSFTTRRWDIPRISGSDSDLRAYKVAESVSYQFRAIGSEDPKSGNLGKLDIVTLAASGDGGGNSVQEQVIFGLGSDATAIASCYIDISGLTFDMPKIKTTAFKEPGILEASKMEKSIPKIECDRDVNVRFTLSATNTVAGYPNVLAPEAGGAEGVGATFKYRFIDTDGGGGSESHDLTLAKPFNLLDGPVGKVRRTYFYLTAYYYRFGEEVKAGQFRSTATLNVWVE